MSDLNVAGAAIGITGGAAALLWVGFMLVRRILKSSCVLQTGTTRLAFTARVAPEGKGMDSPPASDQI